MVSAVSKRRLCELADEIERVANNEDSADENVEDPHREFMHIVESAYRTKGMRARFLTTLCDNVDAARESRFRWKKERKR